MQHFTSFFLTSDLLVKSGLLLFNTAFAMVTQALISTVNLAQFAIIMLPQQLKYTTLSSRFLTCHNLYCLEMLITLFFPTFISSP
jgi:hypothetical protein